MGEVFMKNVQNMKVSILNKHNIDKKYYKYIIFKWIIMLISIKQDN